MKKILIITLLIITAAQLNAQTAEPTKEETIKYIDSWLKQNVEGKETTESLLISKISFTGDNVTMVIPSIDPKFSNTYSFTGMDWSAYSHCIFNKDGGFSIFLPT